MKFAIHRLDAIYISSSPNLTGTLLSALFISNVEL